MFVGPSYQLDNVRASAQRTVNLMLRPIEAGNERHRFVLDSVPGLIRQATIGGEIRGVWSTGDRLFVVSGLGLYEVAADWAVTLRGTMLTSSGTSGPVSMASGLTQLAIVDGKRLYTLTLADNTFALASDPDTFGQDCIGWTDNVFTLTGDGQKFLVSATDDATTVSALDFGSVEGAPDDVWQHLIIGSELFMFGPTSIEVWFYTGDADFPFSRNRSAFVEVGLFAKNTLQKMDGAAFFVGADKTGPASVYILRGYQPQRISTRAVEEALSKADLAGASAYTWTRNGSKVYAINAPGLGSTWCYDLLTQSWFEMADVNEAGEYTGWRITHGASFGGESVLLGNGALYTFSDSTYTFDGDDIVRERTSTHDTAPNLERRQFGAFFADVRTGGAALGVDPQIGLSWSDDAGETWGNTLFRSLGKTGERFSRLTWRRLGQSRHRVWRLKCSDAAPFSIIDGGAM